MCEDAVFDEERFFASGQKETVLRDAEKRLLPAPDRLPSMCVGCGECYENMGDRQEH